MAASANELVNRLLAPKRELPPAVARFVKKLLQSGYGVRIYYDRNRKAYDAKVTRTGKLEETFCN